MADLLSTKPFSILTVEAQEKGEKTLRRTLGPFSLTALGIGATVGAGIFIVPDIVAGLYAGPAVVLSLIMAGIVCLIGGLCYAEIASVIPISGSAYTYAYASLGEIFAWLIGWNLILEYMVAAAAVASAWGSYVLSLLQDFGFQVSPKLIGNFGEEFVLYQGRWIAVVNLPASIDTRMLRHEHAFVNVLAILLVLIMTTILVRGIRESSSFGSAAVSVKLLVLFLFVGIAGMYALRHFGTVSANLHPFIPPQFGWKGVLTGAAIAFFCYSGFDSICTTAQESRNPQKDLPFAIIATLAVCGALYVLISALLVGIVPYSKLGSGSGLILALEQANSSWGRVILEIGGILGLAAACLMLLLGSSRITYSMSRDGLLWKWGSSIHPRFRSPWISSLVAGGIVAILTAVAPIARLVTLASVGSLITFAVVCASVAVLRQKRPDLVRVFRAPWVPWLPALGMVSCVALLVSLPGLAWTGLTTWCIGGLVIYFSYGRMHSTVAVRTSRHVIPLKEQPNIVLPEPPDPPGELVQACAAGDCVVALGSGVGAQAGYPTWTDLVGELLDWSLKRGLVDESSGPSLRTAVKAGDANSVIDAILHSKENARRELSLHLQDIFFDRKPPSAVHNAISAIKPAGVLTSNFDRLMEETLERGGGWRTLTSTDGDRLLTMLTTRERFVVKVYGDLQRPDTVLLGTGDYAEAVAANASFAQFMDAIFFSKTLLFLGTSLDGLEDYVQSNFLRAGAAGQASKNHFGLVPVEGYSWKAKADVLRRRYSINVIPYTPTPGHPELLAFLRRLDVLIQSQRHVETADQGLRETLPLRRVAFRNVGPFDELEMSLDQSWNVLLGDNGVGKSTILKAITLAIAGKDAEGYAARIIKTGKENASIILETAQNTYTIQLTRNEQGAEVRVLPPVRPLEVEGWLAIAFPPLRNATWRDTKLVSPSDSNRPKTSDLLPMVAGDVDPRMDSLKEWLVGLDYVIKDYLNSGKDASKERRLFAAVFETIQELTPGVTVKFKEVLAKTLRVMVETDDGIVPLEAVSQGTMSLISWVGILVQRMFEVYGDIPGIDPTKQFALVIVDEIDVHMHPKWQQLIVGSLKKLFPKVQFIVTTHSPLIVVGLGPEAVFLVRREDTDRSKIRVERPSIEMKGWRADQMLTGPLFNLTTSTDLQLFEKTKRYTYLAARTELTAEQTRELKLLSAELSLRLPTSKEREEARIAFDALEGAINEKLKSLPQDKQRAILEEARVQLQENITDSRRKT